MLSQGILDNRHVKETQDLPNAEEVNPDFYSKNKTKTPTV